MATTIQDLEERVDALYNSILQMQQNLNPVTEKADDTANKVEQITPTTYTKTAYIGDTEVVFTDVQGTTGNLSVFFDNDNIGADYTVSRFVNSIVIGFLKPLEEVTQVTISII